MDCSSKLPTSSSGKALFFKRSKKTPSLTVANVSSRHSYNILFENSKKIHYIECRNLHCIPRMGKKCAIAIFYDDIWHLGMIAALPLKDDLLHYFEWIGGEFENLPSNARWQDYMKYFVFKSLKNATVVFLNQINGCMAGNRSIKQDLINKVDKGVQHSLLGCDLLIPDYVVIPYKNYFSTTTIHAPLFSVTETLPSLFKPYCNNQLKRKRIARHFSNKSTRKDHVHTIIYVQDIPSLRTKVDKSHAIGGGIIPVPFLMEKNKSKFAYLHVDDIKKLKKNIHGRSFEDHDNFLHNNNCGIETLLILDEHSFKHHLSIHLIPNMIEAELLQKCHVLQASSPVIVTEEFDSVQEQCAFVKGSVEVSTWVRCKEANHHDVTRDEVDVYFKAYSYVGYGNRNTVKSVGFSKFLGLKNEGNRSMPTPVAGPGTLSDVQYHRARYNPLYQAVAEKSSNVLAAAAESTSRALDVNIHSILPNHKCPPGYGNNILGTCHKKIITSGVPNKWLGYACCQHVDTVDKYKGEKKIAVTKMKESLKGSPLCYDKKIENYIKSFEQFGPFGRKTTCVYQFIGKESNKECKVIIYFLMQGLGIAVKFDSHLCHSFFGYLFTHCTALPVIVVDGRVYYHHEEIVIFAWGAA
jgi:hypothetical protein